MELSEFSSPVGEWLRGEGPEADIVISSRIRLARNLAGHRFLTRASQDELLEIESDLGGYLKTSDARFSRLYFRIPNLSETDRHVLVERHLISREHMAAEAGRAVAVSEDERMSVMINEEDHLRIQVLRSGLRLAEAYNEIDDLDAKISERFEIAFDPKWGYLTACPTNVGTGIRVSVMMHLPALVLTKEIDKLFRAVAKINLAVRGLYGEGTQAYGDLYQISNQTSLGKSEDKLIENIESVVPGVIEYERKAREHIFKANRVETEDRLWRAVGALKSARLLSSEEAMHLLSAVRLGVSLGVLPALRGSSLNELFLLTQPAHLQKIVGRDLAPAERDLARAAYVRDKLISYS